MSLLLLFIVFLCLASLFRNIIFLLFSNSYVIYRFLCLGSYLENREVFCSISYVIYCSSLFRFSN